MKDFTLSLSDLSEFVSGGVNCGNAVLALLGRLDEFGCLDLQHAPN